MRKLLILFLLIIITNLFSFNVTLQNGDKVKGKLILVKRNWYYVFAKDTLLMINRNIVESIDFDNNYEPNMVFRPSRQKINLVSFPNIIRYDVDSINGRMLPAFEKKQFHRPKLILLSLSVGFSIFSYEYFDDSNELNKLIKIVENNNEIVPKSLTNERKEKLLFGWTFLGLGIITTMVALDKVEISSGINYLEVSYKF